jgi:hypothetical protein
MRAQSPAGTRPPCRSRPSWFFKVQMIASTRWRSQWGTTPGSCWSGHAQAQLGEERFGLLAGQALVGDDRRTWGWPVGRLVGQQLPGVLALAHSLGLAKPNPVTVPSTVTISMSLAPQEQRLCEVS